ncbi:Shedu immune nuclease family protein [Bradyrhizobium elkanii]|jgi:antiviral defense system Shedu protein SduA|uniref:Shedu immune nuclease family protein n=1 Tax=Bradyrhizobium elkanii TaxID=29448 RepID=UPI002714CF24|nr:Shedu immune nuclease family protein [Bradyrhizobium elkanii]WLB05130.1 DUF4263 domain-containing protein [Bradyrhizobium elkanii]
MEEDERSFHFNKRTDKTYVSRRIVNSVTGEHLRIGSKVIDSDEGLVEVRKKDEIAIRTTPKTRQEIKATFFEDSRNISTLTIQKFNAKSGPSEHTYFSFRDDEINTLLQFIVNTKRIPFADANRINITDSELNEIILNAGQARRVFVENEEVFLALAQNEVLTRDLVAVGYRRAQLQHFERLLSEPAFFEREKDAAHGGAEAVWQAFFEKNKWIFGYGLSYVFLDGLDGRKLEQITSGFDLAGAGKRSDALLKTRASISSLCFVEIKRHDTQLLSTSQYRPEVWSPSSDLTGGVAQLQAVVQSTLERLGRTVSPSDDHGNPSGEVLFNVAPRSFLVAGTLDEFTTDHGINETKYRSFELFRRNVKQPEILTFDELLHRARFIVEHA